MNPDVTSNHHSFVMRHHWIFVIAAFALLLGAWATLIVVAIKNAPQRVELNR